MQVLCSRAFSPASIHPPCTSSAPRFPNLSLQVPVPCSCIFVVVRCVFSVLLCRLPCVGPSLSLSPLIAPWALIWCFLNRGIRGFRHFWEVLHRPHSCPQSILSAFTLLFKLLQFLQFCVACLFPPTVACFGVSVIVSSLPFSLF